MRIRLALLFCVLLLTIVIMPGGYSYWQENLSIQGKIKVDAPVLESLTGSAILDQVVQNNLDDLNQSERQMETAPVPMKDDAIPEISVPTTENSVPSYTSNPKNDQDNVNDPNLENSSDSSKGSDLSNESDLVNHSDTANDAGAADDDGPAADDDGSAADDGSASGEL